MKILENKWKIGERDERKAYKQISDKRGNTKTVNMTHLGKDAREDMSEMKRDCIEKGRIYRLT